MIHSWSARTLSISLKRVRPSSKGKGGCGDIARHDRRSIMMSFARMRENKDFQAKGSEDQWQHPIYASERVKEKKSVFLVHASTLRTPTELEGFISHLTSLPALKKATHCMYAYRIVPDLLTPSVKMVGQHDGGEKGSGERLSRLLEALQCTNVVVVVSRWYGGVKLGSDRWKLISTVAKEALYKGNFAKELPLNVTNVATPKQNTKKRK